MRCRLRRGDLELTCPQNVVSKTIELSLNFESISQPLPENRATGVPQLAGFGEPDEISAGISARGKKYTAMADDVHSMAYTPPPAALKAAP